MNTGAGVKILMIAPVRVHSMRPLRWLLDHGCEVTFMDHEDPAPKPRRGYTFVPFPRGNTRRNRERFGPAIAHRIAHDLITRRLGPLWNRINPDVVHVHWVDRRAWQCVCAGLRPLVLSVWGSDINTVTGYPDLNAPPEAAPDYCRLISRTVAGADRIIVDTPEMADRCARLAGGPVATDLIHLGVDTKRFRPGFREGAKAWRRSLAIPEGTTALLSVRAWGRQYNHHEILEAFGRASRRLDPKPVLLFKLFNARDCPDSRAYARELQRQGERLGVRDAIRFLDEVPAEKLPDLYAAADAVVNYPSRDTLPVSILEAAACGRPVISCRLPGYQGTFAERCFRMVELGNPEALAEAIVEFVNEDPSDRAGPLAEARTTVMSEYEESIAARRYLELYERLLGPRPDATGSCRREQTG